MTSNKADQDRQDALKQIEHHLRELHDAMQTANVLGVRFTVNGQPITGAVGNGVDLKYKYVSDSELAEIDRVYNEEVA